MRRVFGFFVILWQIFPVAFSSAVEMTLITEEAAPFNYTENKKLTGATTSVVREIARRLEIADTIEMLPWARGYRRLCSEPNVALFTTVRKPEREALFHWVGPLYVGKKNDFYIAISKTTAPEVAQEWQTVLDDMKADGTFLWLTRKWLPADSIAVSDRKAADSKSFSLKVYTEDYPPSAYVENGKIKGISVEIVQEILRRTGQPDTIAIVPWARGYQLALSEANTVLFSTTRLPQREDLFSWVGPLYRQRWGFYRWKGSDVLVADLDAARKVARIGTYHQDAKMQYLLAKGFDNLVPTNLNIANMAHLERGNIDLWVSSDFNLAHLARQAGVPSDRLELACAFHTVHNYIAVSKATSPHVVRLWQAVLEEMKSDGSYRRICKNYDYSPE